MTDKQESELTSCTEGMTYLQTNHVLVDVVADIVTYKVGALIVIGKINDEATIQTRNDKGKTQNKANMREILELAVINVKEKVVGSVYCRTNTDLKGLVERTDTQIKTMLPAELIRYSRSVFTNVNPILVALEGSGLVADDMTAITTGIAGFDPVKAAPKTAKAQTKAATDTMKPNFISLKEYIVLISNLFINLISNDDLYNGWFNLIKVYKTGIRHTLRDKELAPSETVAWTKVIANSNIRNTSTEGKIRVGAGKKLTDVTEWIVIDAGGSFLNFFGPNVIIESLSPTSFLHYTLHSKSLNGKDIS